MCDSSDIGDALFEGFVPKVNDSVIMDSLETTWKRDGDEFITAKWLGDKEAASHKHIDSLGLARQRCMDRRVQFRYRGDPVKISPSSVQEVVSMKKNEFVKNLALGANLRPFSWEQMMRPVENRPKVVENEVGNPLNVARDKALEGIEPHHWEDAGVLKKLIAAKQGVTNKHDAFQGLELQ